MGRAHAHTCAAVAALFLGLASPVAAQPSDEARRAYQRGDALYLAGKYDEAIVELTRAYELSGAPELLFNIAQAQREGGHCREAVVGYETYLQRAPKGRRAADARAFLAELGDCSTWKPPVRPDAGATSGAKDAPGGEPGAAKDRPAVVPAPDEPVGGKVVPPAGGPGATGRMDDPGRGRRTAGLVVAGVGLAALGAGGYFGLRARSKWNDAKAHCDDMLRCDPDGIDLHDQASTAATLSNVGVGLGLAGLAAGAFLWFTAPRATPVREVAVTRAPGDGWALVLAGEF